MARKPQPKKNSKKTRAQNPLLNRKIKKRLTEEERVQQLWRARAETHRMVSELESVHGAAEIRKLFNRVPAYKPLLWGKDAQSDAAVVELHRELLRRARFARSQMNEGLDTH